MSFAVRPPPEVLEVVTALPRPLHDGVTWSEPEQWIVKLRPLGHVSTQLQQPLVEVVEAELDGAPPTPVRLGPATRRVAGQWLGIPVTGLEELAAAVFTATEPLVPVTHPQPFQADLFVARGRAPKALAGTEVAAAWTVRKVLLIADRSAPRRLRLDELAAIPLTG